MDQALGYQKKENSTYMYMLQKYGKPTDIHRKLKFSFLISIYLVVFENKSEESKQSFAESILPFCRNSSSKRSDPSLSDIDR